MDIDAFILIGGRSSRMGMDKAFVHVGGETLAARAVSTIERGLLPKRISFVAADATQFKTELLFGLGRPVVTDIKPGFGAWSAVDTALGYAQTEWILILACDLPYVSSELLGMLATFAGEEIEAVVARQSDGRLQPLCALYKVKPVRLAVDAIFTGRSVLPGITTLFEDLKTRIVEPDVYRGLSNAGRFFLNVNTVADLNAVKEL